MLDQAVLQSLLPPFSHTAVSTLHTVYASTTSAILPSSSLSTSDGLRTLQPTSLDSKEERIPEHVYITSDKSGYSSVSDSIPNETHDWEYAGYSLDEPEDSTASEHVQRQIPDYVLEYAPLVHLFSGEQYWPGDIAEHLRHVTPTLNYTPIQQATEHPTLKNLDQYNEFENARWVFLTSQDDPETYPDWMGGRENIPKPVNGSDEERAKHSVVYHLRQHSCVHGFKAVLTRVWMYLTSFTNLQQFHRQSDASNPQAGRSDAPAVLIVVNKGHGVVDAFWFYFYSFNQGNTVFNIRFGNHIGDWEHTCVRFKNGTPQAVFYSEHNFGSAYSYKAVEKYGKRPVIYSATGTHANYATPGLHPYVLPYGILHDQTDRGPLWDPALNAHTYTYDYQKRLIRASNMTPNAPTEWFDFAGHWGDKTYPLADSRQYRLFGQYHYVSGPLGPKFKNLGRKQVCGGPDTQPCVIKRWLRQEETFGSEFPSDNTLDV